MSFLSHQKRSSASTSVSLLLLALILITVSINNSRSSPYKIRLDKYLTTSDEQEDCDYDDYPEPEEEKEGSNNRKIEVNKDSEQQYSEDEEDCEDEEKSGSEPEARVESRDDPQDQCCPNYDTHSQQEKSSSDDADSSAQNVIPATNNKPEFPQWGAHAPKDGRGRDYDGNNGVSAREDDSSPDYPEITNVQGKSPQTPISPYPGFSRRCDSYFECDFATPYTNTSEEIQGSTWFACDGTHCICELFGVTRDGVPLKVAWSKQLKKCLSGFMGPCGRHNGLNIYCDMGFICDNFVCDKPGRKKTTTPKPPCDDGCPDGDDCEDEEEDDRRTSLFSFLFFPSNTFHNVLNNSLHGIFEQKG